jgi:hypothetical protein
MYLKYSRFLVRVPRDPFFAEGDKLCKINEAILLTIEDVEEFLHRYRPTLPFIYLIPFFLVAGTRVADQVRYSFYTDPVPAF